MGKGSEIAENNLLEAIMEEKNMKKLNKTHILFIVFGALALLEIGAFWLFSGNEAATVYVFVGLYLVLPMGALFASYMMTVDEEPKGFKIYLPIILGTAIGAVWFLTFGVTNLINGNSVGVPLLQMFLGAFASLVGLSFAKKDRTERRREEQKRKKREKAMGIASGDVTETAYEPKHIDHEDDYNPGRDFIPDANDTWADEIIAREGFGEMKVDYAEYDADFSIDLPGADENIRENEPAIEPCEEVAQKEAAEELQENTAEEAAEEVAESEVIDEEREAALDEINDEESEKAAVDNESEDELADEAEEGEHEPSCEEEVEGFEENLDDDGFEEKE